MDDDGEDSDPNRFARLGLVRVEAFRQRVSGRGKPEPKKRGEIIVEEFEDKEPKVTEKDLKGRSVTHSAQFVHQRTPDLVDADADNRIDSERQWH